MTKADSLIYTGAYISQYENDQVVEFVCFDPMLCRDAHMKARAFVRHCFDTAYAGHDCSLTSCRSLFGRT